MAEPKAESRNGQPHPLSSFQQDKYHEADLTRGMEHMRPYVSVEQATSPQPRKAPKPSQASSPDDDESHKTYGVPSHLIDPPRTGHPNHTTQDIDPSVCTPQLEINPSSNPESRTNPAQFGTRYLQPSTNIFTHNAWDDVNPLDDPSYLHFTSTQYTFQKQNPAPKFWADKISKNPERSWDIFYKNNEGRFFKDRKWLGREFPGLESTVRGESEDEKGEDGKGKEVHVAELGAGVGNTILPLLTACVESSSSAAETVRFYALDYSKMAIQHLQSHELYTTHAPSGRITAAVWDLAAPTLPTSVMPGTITHALLIFCLSALSPAQHVQAVRNVYEMLAPGGEVLFRDYARGDLAQVRMRKGRWLGEEGFYCRGDGTRVYFFEEEGVRRLFTGEEQEEEEGRYDSGDGDGEEDGEMNEEVNGQTGAEKGEEATGELEKPGHEVSQLSRPKFEVVQLKTDRRLLVNRQRKLKMYRCWLTGIFKKPVDTSS